MAGSRCCLSFFPLLWIAFISFHCISLQFSLLASNMVIARRMSDASECRPLSTFGLSPASIYTASEFSSRALLVLCARFFLLIFCSHESRFISSYCKPPVYGSLFSVLMSRAFFRRTATTRIWFSRSVPPSHRAMASRHRSTTSNSKNKNLLHPG